MSDPSPLPILKAEGRVLSTLESDGSRRWLTPRLAKGRFLARRQVVAYALIAIYAILPFLTINGRPAVQLDLWNARFALFGFEFRPTDLELLAVFGLMTFLSIFLATALFGRVWCGWACPQTVYMEHVFRPLERLFTGTAGRGGKPTKAVAGWRTPLMYLVFLLICWHLANTFLAYFVGVEALNRWIWSEPPWRHPGAFALVLFVTALMMFDFCYWREQLCIIGCPYGRFQSVLLDRSSLVVGYDTVRGEQRGRGKEREAKGLGDCVDCSMCVHVCPTGIDIRDGLQLECVNCTQCIDACDAVMDKIGRPRGLIRYSSQAAFEGGASKLVRPARGDLRRRSRRTRRLVRRVARQSVRVRRDAAPRAGTPVRRDAFGRGREHRPRETRQPHRRAARVSRRSPCPGRLAYRRVRAGRVGGR